MSTRQQRIAELARQASQVGFTSLNHHLDFTWLLVAYWSTRRDGASGVDGITAADYEADLAANLRSLLDRAKSGSYRAPPVRRVHISKGPGSKETRPIGYQRWRTRFSSGRLSCCCNRSMSRTSSRARTGSGQGDRHTRLWRTYGSN